MTRCAVHVTRRAFSAQPTLRDQLGPEYEVHELPLPEALAYPREVELVWISEGDPAAIAAMHARYPDSPLLVTLPRFASTADVLEALALGADLVLRDEGIVLAAAALAALGRRHQPA
jgi:hypothetical protein